MLILKNTIWVFGILFLLGSCAPLAKFSQIQKTPTAPSKVVFQNDSKNADSYSWDFGDGNKSEEAAPSHVFTKSGKYTVTLSAKKGSKVKEAKQIIEVTPPEICLVELSTDYGKMIIELSDATPLHRDNFVKLVEEGFYNDLLFHRVVNGFMIQGGDPNSRGADQNKRLGTGGPGYQIPAEFVDELAHVKGAIAAARTPDAGNPEKKSSGSQFYIVHGSPVNEAALRRQEAKMDKYYTPEIKEAYLKNGGTAFLDGNYTVFGRVISGLEVIDKIAAVPTDGDPPQGASRPKKNVKMTFKIIE